MQYSLSNRLSSNVSGIDPDAKAYIAAVETALGTPIATALPNASNPKRTISDFIKAEKAASRWTLHKRIFLPIYANAAASAIDMVSRTSGEFTISGVTHAAGYVQGDGTSGYFNTLTTSSVIGQSSGNASHFALVKSYTAVAEQSLFGCVTTGFVSANQIRITNLSSSFVHPNGSAIVAANMESGGIIVGSSTSTSYRFVKGYKSASSAINENTSLQTSSIPNITLFAMARNLNGPINPNNFSSSQLGSFGTGLGMTVIHADEFSNNLKTLWESLTGLNLP